MAETVDQNIATMRRAYDAFNRGDMDTLRQLWTDDVVWPVGGRNRLSGEKRGADAIIAYFGQLIEASGGTLKVELHDVVGNEQHILSMHTLSAQHQGQPLSIHFVLVTHVRDGKFSEVWEHTDDRHALDVMIG